MNQSPTTFYKILHNKRKNKFKGITEKKYDPSTDHFIVQLIKMKK